ncbi:transcriptional activator FtrA [compost metagenome]
MTVTRWLNAQRVIRAQQLLETTDLPVERIAHEVGFGAALSLRQQFAIQLGVTPADYRRSFRKGGGGAGDRGPDGTASPLSPVLV